MKVLIIDDEKYIADSIAETFVNRGHVCEIAYSFEDAIFKLKRSIFDIVTLDLLLNEHRGETVLRNIKLKNINASVLVITAIDAEKNKILLLEQGVDDYITKPFSRKEMVLRAENIYRRGNRCNVRGHKSLSYYRNIKFDWERLLIFVNSKKIHITQKEKLFLQILLERKREIVSKDELSNLLWSLNKKNKENLLRVLVARLRIKLATVTETELIKNIRGRGYMLAISKKFSSKTMLDNDI